MERIASTGAQSGLTINLPDSGSLFDTSKQDQSGSFVTYVSIWM